MLINAFNLANEQQAKLLDNWMECENPDPQEKIAAIMELYNEIGIDKLAADKINFFFKEGLKLLEKVGVDDDRKQELLSYTKEMMKREY